MRFGCCRAATIQQAESRGFPRSDIRGAILSQVLYGLIANLGSVAPGMTLGFSAVAIPQMKDPNATFTINDDQASWMASLASLSTAAGCLVSGSLMDRFGRKTALLGINIPCVIGWLLIAFAKGDATLGMVYAGRILTGLATGMSSSPPPVYSAEISSDALRGLLVTWTSLGISLGILIVYILGTLIADWRLVAGISAALPILSFLLTFIFLPESPAWLSNKGRHDDAAKVMLKIHGTANFTKPKPPDSSPEKPLLRVFFSSATLKPFLIMNLFFFFQQFSGTFVVVFYAVDIVKEAGINFDPYIAAILIGLTRFLVTIVVSFVSNRYGRRPPAIVSGAGMTLTMGSLATYLYLSSTGAIAENDITWFPVVSLMLYILTSTIGFLTLPWAMVGEVYPARVRGLAAGLTTFFAYFCNFIIVKIYPAMLFSLQRYGLFFFYGGVSVLGTIFVVLLLPETKGRDLQQIEEYFQKKKKKKMKEITDEEEARPLQNVGNSVVIVPSKEIS